MITNATYLRHEVLGPSRYQVVLTLTDDVAGVYTREFQVTGTTQAEAVVVLRNQIASLNEGMTFKNILAGIAPGTNVPITRPAPAAPTALAVWLAKYARLITAVSPGAFPAG